MKHMVIDGISCEFENERNVLEVAKKHHIDIPNLCYCESLSIYGGCRLCVVENERGAVEAACSMQPKDGLVIKTNTARLRKHRQMILELLLAGHRAECTTCEKSGKCKLQTYARRYNVTNIRFANEYCKLPIDDSSPSIVRDPSKCILCGKCVRMCSEVQNIHAVDFAERGIETYISCGFDNKLADTKCVGCGQCAAVCPTGAIVVKKDTERLWEDLADSNTRVIAQIAPAVRTGVSKTFNEKYGDLAMGKLVAALRRMGFDEVFDTSTSADLTVLEESSEFLERLETGGKLPLYTSCCPAWIRFAETRHPEILENISTCRSPMEMFGSVIKEYFGNCGKRVVSVAIMPCTAKKFEAMRDEFRDKNGTPYVDYVITSQEIVQMIRQSGIRFDELEPEAVSMPFGMSSGAGLIFGASGGVTEAVLRRISDDKSSGAIRSIANSGVRDIAGLKECSITHNGEEIKIAIVSGLENTDKLIHRIEEGEVSYHMVEVMACPGGCVSGAGQPFAKSGERRQRSESLYRNDRMCLIRRSEENPLMEELYSGILKDRTHELLHVDYVK